MYYIRSSEKCENLEFLTEVNDSKASFSKLPVFNKIIGCLSELVEGEDRDPKVDTSTFHGRCISEGRRISASWFALEAWTFLSSFQQQKNNNNNQGKNHNQDWYSNK